MDEFVKRLYDFMGIYRIFWSQNSHYRYFFRKANTCAGEIKVTGYFSEKTPKKSPKNRRFFHFFRPKHACEARAPQSRFFSGKIGIFRFFG